MPYIDTDRRLVLDSAINKVIVEMNVLQSHNELVKGDLNYICYRLGKAFIKTKGMRYQHISDAVDGIRGAGEELKRRVQDEYENACVLKNGDVE